MTLLRQNIPLALAIGTEKASSELIIINLLLEVKNRTKIGLFSGIDFTVDKEKGLSGCCDFIISRSPEQLYLDTPVVALVEAKNERIISGLGQCVAEMIAARIHNEREGNNVPCIFGAVTTGYAWKFLKLEGNRAYYRYRGLLHQGSEKDCRHFGFHGQITTPNRYPLKIEDRHDRFPIRTRRGR